MRDVLLVARAWDDVVYCVRKRVNVYECEDVHRPLFSAAPSRRTGVCPATTNYGQVERECELIHALLSILCERVVVRATTGYSMIRKVDVSWTRIVELIKAPRGRRR